MALAESSVEDIEKQSLKCRKCRFLVIEDPPHKILNLSTTGLLTDDDLDSSNTFNICDDNLPYWISAAIEEVDVYRLSMHCHCLNTSDCRLAGLRGSFPVPDVVADLEGLTT